MTRTRLWINVLVVMATFALVLSVAVVAKFAYKVDAV